MKRISFFFALIYTAFVCISCVGTNPRSSGRPFELLVVIEPQLWDAPAGQAIQAALDMDVPGLPQSEPSFRVMHAAPQHFDSTLKLIRNVIVVEMSDKFTKGSFKSAKDLYANSQVILTIQAPDAESLEAFVNENRAAIVSYFTRIEMNRQIQTLEKSHSARIDQLTDSLFGSHIWIPAELQSYKVGQDFLWASTNAASGDRNVVIYSYPYTDKDTFTKDFFVRKRDSVMQVNIPGYKEGVYMGTDSLLTTTKAISVQKEYAFEARGLWRMVGDFMGGPYVSHTRLDKTKNRIITAEVFVYSPDKMKRNLIRLMEASLYTLRLPGDSTATAIPLDMVNERTQ